MDELDLTDAEKKATYQKIKNYVLEHRDLKVRTGGFLHCADRSGSEDC